MIAGLRLAFRRTLQRQKEEREEDGAGVPPRRDNPRDRGERLPGTHTREQPLKAGEFILGYTDETGGLPPMPHPDVLGRNGTYVVFLKLHQRVTEFRRYLKEMSRSPEEEELLAAKMMGRRRSGAHLAICPHRDDPELGADPRRNNDFAFADDPTGYKTPPGCHIRRANPRDASVAGVRPAPPDAAPRNGLRARAPRGCPFGRRCRSRFDVRLSWALILAGSSSSSNRSG